MRLLYVEDEPALAMTVASLLRQLGYDFDTATNGVDALTLASSNSYDLILLDMSLPDMDGSEVIDRLRNAGVSTPLIYQTASMASFGSLGLPELENGDILIKPFNRKELIRTIEVTKSRAAQDGLADRLLGPRVERRQFRRTNDIKSGRVLNGSTLECQVLNLSDGGALLRLFDEDKPLSGRFVLTVRGVSDHHCEVRWRQQSRVGVRFLRSF